MQITIIRHSIRNLGADQVIFDYASFLVSQGHQVTYWTNEINTRFSFDHGIKIKKIPHQGVLGTMWFTLTTIFTTDIVLVDLVVMACLSWVRNRRKVICLAQDYDVSYYRLVVLRSLTAMAYVVALQLMKIRFICVSKHLEDELGQHGPRSLITTVNNGIDLSKFYHHEGSRFISLRKAKIVVGLYVRNEYRKGVDIAIKALQLLAEKGAEDWELWVFGQDEGFPDIKGVKITHFGYLSEEDLRDFLSAVDIYTAASRHEGLSLLSLQAMACGCALAVSSAFTNVQDGVTGYVSPIDDYHALASHLRRLIESKESRECFKNNGYNSIRSFDMMNSKARLVRLLIMN